MIAKKSIPQVLKSKKAKKQNHSWLNPSVFSGVAARPLPPTFEELAQRPEGQRRPDVWVTICLRRCWAGHIKTSDLSTPYKHDQSFSPCGPLFRTIQPAVEQQWIKVKQLDHFINEKGRLSWNTNETLYIQLASRWLTLPIMHKKDDTNSKASGSKALRASSRLLSPP